MKVILLIFILFSLSGYCQDTLLFQRETCYPRPHGKFNTKSEYFTEMYSVADDSIIELNKKNDSIFIFVYDKEKIEDSKCIPFWLKYQEKYFIIYVYTNWVIAQSSLDIHLYRFRYRLKKGYGCAVSKGSCGYSHVLIERSKIQYDPPSISQSRICLSVPEGSFPKRNTVFIRKRKHSILKEESAP